MSRQCLRVLSLVVLAGLLLVHQSTGVVAAGKPKGGGKGANTGQSPQHAGALPAPVQEMIDLIRDAADSGDIEVLRDAIDWNEMKPDFGTAGVTDPIAHFKAQSADGSGRDILAVLKLLLDGPPAIVPYGRDVENNRLFVWPRFADAPLKGLAGDDLTRFEALVAAEARAAMLSAERYSGWQLVLGADGTWHAFGQGAVGAKPK